MNHDTWQSVEAGSHSLSLVCLSACQSSLQREPANGCHLLLRLSPSRTCLWTPVAKGLLR